MAKTDTPQDPTISVPEAGRLLGVGRSVAYEAAALGQIPVIRIGRQLRVPRLALDQMLKTGVQPPHQLEASGRADREAASAA